MMQSIRTACSGLFISNVKTVWNNGPLAKLHLPRIANMNQGEKIHAVFPKEEFEGRLTRLRAQMKAENIGGIVFTSTHNVAYYSGFIYTSFGRNYGLVITPEISVILSAGIDGGQPWRRSLGADDCITYTDWHKDNFFYCIKNSFKFGEGDIGIEFDHVTIDNKKKFELALPEKSLTDIGKLTMSLRMLKSEEEIKVIRQGARIADIGGFASVEALQDGVPETAVAGHVVKAMNAEINKTYPESEQMDTWAWIQAGINTDGAHNPLTNRKIRNGDIISLNAFPMISGYYTALERTLFLNYASDDNLKIWEHNCDVHRIGLGLIKPGAVCSDIAKELNNLYAEKGLLKFRSFGYGHSFGCLSHYYGREADLELREDVHTVLKPNMVVSMEPMVMIPEGMPGAGGYREHDILIVTEEGSENITKFPFGPEKNIIIK